MQPVIPGTLTIQVHYILMSFRDMQALFPLLTYAACHLRNTDHTTAMETRHHSNIDHTTPFDASHLRNTDHTTLLEACTSGTLTIKLHWRPITSGSETMTIRVNYRPVITGTLTIQFHLMHVTSGSLTMHLHWRPFTSGTLTIDSIGGPSPQEHCIYNSIGGLSPQEH